MILYEKSKSAIFRAIVYCENQPGVKDISNKRSGEAKKLMTTQLNAFPFDQI